MQRRRLDLQRASVDFRNRHARTASNITRKNTRRAYERVYGDERLYGEYLAPERVDFYRELAAVAAGLRPRAVVDVGCGSGNLLHEVVSLAAPERIVGIDYARAGVRRARGLVPAGEFHVGNLYDVGLEETFDLVLCTEVLEHVPDPERAVQRLVALCARSGAVVITVPDGASDEWEGHLNFWTQAELQQFLGRFGEVEVTKRHGDLLAILRP